MLCDGDVIVAHTHFGKQKQLCHTTQNANFLQKYMRAYARGCNFVFDLRCSLVRECLSRGLLSPVFVFSSTRTAQRCRRWVAFGRRSSRDGVCCLASFVPSARSALELLMPECRQGARRRWRRLWRWRWWRSREVQPLQPSLPLLPLLLTVVSRPSRSATINCIYI